MRKQSISYRVYLTPEEKVLIKRSADDCEMSMSAYSRTILLGGKPSGKLDIAQCKMIESGIANLNRLGNLMKMLLTNTERLNDMGRGMGEATIDGILVDIRVSIAKLKELVDIVHDSHLATTPHEPVDSIYTDDSPISNAVNPV